MSRALLFFIFFQMIRSLNVNFPSSARFVSKSALARNYCNKPLSFDVHQPAGNNAWNSAVFLHGILGNKRNWRSFGHEFVKQHENYQSVAIDHRGHGSSPILYPPNTVSACADDLIDLFGSGLVSCSQPPRMICAHSFGGKVALSYLQKCMELDLPLPQYTWILDSLPGTYDKRLDATSSQSVSGIINLVASLPKEFESKEWVINELQRKGIARDIALWLGMNVIRSDGDTNQFMFSFDIDTIIELFEDYCSVDMWPFLHHYSGSSKIQFIRAGKNLLWTTDVLEQFQRLNKQNPNIVLHTMSHVGHWLHADDMHGTLKIISDNSP